MIETLARRLDAARREGVATTQLSASCDLELDDAYAVQRAGIALRTRAGERVTGVKLGFTSKAKAVQMGVDDVIIGVLTDAMEVADGGFLDIGTGVSPRIEPEVAFRVTREVDMAEPDADLREAVDAVAPALEIIDSRYQDFSFSLADVIADNTSASAFVVGPWIPFDRDMPLPLAGRMVELRIDGDVVERGSTSDILGDPWKAIPTVLRMARRHGQQLPAGSVVLAGVATAAASLTGATRVDADVDGLGSVSVAIGEQQADGPSEDPSAREEVTRG